MAHDMTATAKVNRATIRAAADASVAADSSGRLAAFRRLVDSSSFTTNVSAHKVTTFGRVGELLDARQHDVERAGGDQTAGLAAFAVRQGAWLARREAFEDLWHHGRRLVYGAVNAGGMGTEGLFGPFCLASADPTTPVPDALGVFPADSAQRYTTDAADCDGEQARREATSWDRRADLAVTEQGGDALAASTGDWPAVVCRSARYLEAARSGSWPVSALSEVRMRAPYRADLAALRLRWLAGEALDADELNQARAYDVVQEWRRSHGVHLVNVS